MRQLMREISYLYGGEDPHIKQKSHKSVAIFYSISYSFFIHLCIHLFLTQPINVDE